MTKNQKLFLERAKYASRGIPLSGGLFRTAESLEKMGLIKITKNKVLRGPNCFDSSWIDEWRAWRV